MKTLIILIFLAPFFSFGQEKSNTTVPVGYGRTCFGGLGSCSPTNSETPIKNPHFTPNLYDNTLMLKINTSTLDVDQQIALVGKAFNTFGQNERMTFTQNADYIFDATECNTIGVPVDENWQVKSGIYTAFIEQGHFFIILTIRQL